MFNAVNWAKKINGGVLIHQYICHLSTEHKIPEQYLLQTPKNKKPSKHIILQYIEDRLDVSM